jgi:hypothetical protein
MLIADLRRIEAAARTSMGDYRTHDPLPPGPNNGPFGYFRLGILVFAVIVALLWLFGAV